MSTTIQPLKDRVFIKPAPTITKTASGLFLSEKAGIKEHKGTVVAVGPGRVTRKGVLLPMHTKVGDVVMYSKYAGTDVVIDGEDYIIMTDDTIHLVVDNV